jgi:hypothetical protein
MTPASNDSLAVFWQTPFVLDREAHRARAEQIDKDAGDAYQQGMQWLYALLEYTEGDSSLLPLRAQLQTQYNRIVATTACLTTFGNTHAATPLATALDTGDNMSVSQELHAARRECLTLQSLVEALHALYQTACGA